MKGRHFVKENECLNWARMTWAVAGDSFRMHFHKSSILCTAFIEVVCIYVWFMRECMKIKVLYDKMLCWLASCWWCCRGACCLKLPGSRRRISCWLYWLYDTWKKWNEWEVMETSFTPWKNRETSPPLGCVTVPLWLFLVSTDPGFPALLIAVGSLFSFF
jgi:hypothetical protein